MWDFRRQAGPSLLVGRQQAFSNPPMRRAWSEILGSREFPRASRKGLWPHCCSGCAFAARNRCTRIQRSKQSRCTGLMTAVKNGSGSCHQYMVWILLYFSTDCRSQDPATYETHLILLESTTRQSFQLGGQCPLRIHHPAEGSLNPM